MPNQKSLDSLFHLMHAVKRNMHNHIEQLGLSIAPMHVRVLKIINAKDSCTAHDIASLLDRDKAQVTRLLNTLLAEAFIAKAPNPKDKRSQCLRVTDKGKEIVEKISGVDSHVLVNLTKGLSKDDLAKFQEIAEKMKHNMTSQP
ncbi:MarR family transcriptional regulator [Vibrio sp. 10N.286.49.C2]|uniref:MarR family winged helix-turn-helix transcriptional regulator n=1 Tax=unclassified Vibrio TaxID=2614977 RepID=UPI000C82C061|nr:MULTISPECIES: MarR family transcriptional regulator [unclassified Vibrio]PMH42869.1 MarR family transcriptional regulator [Vibrio sp. 10N.286.49.C2]PMH53792.1 MarR family transcriptional regulator [Vibrio sp. 10N.286.49.B1]PMH79799.1 MarR family transcriptional regulator [Vibrio sp. 10N.286.48.B7]